MGQYTLFYSDHTIMNYSIHCTVRWVQFVQTSWQEQDNQTKDPSVVVVGVVKHTGTLKP